MCWPEEDKDQWFDYESRVARMITKAMHPIRGPANEPASARDDTVLTSRPSKLAMATGGAATSESVATSVVSMAKVALFRPTDPANIPTDFSSPAMLSVLSAAIEVTPV